ncbi:CAP domain-containing protein [bacterium]|nr:CAP domain-containing protein [bacterium]
MKRLALLGWLCTRLAGSQPMMDVEQAICEATNKTRQQHSAGPVTLDSVLSDVARKHSEEMLEHGYFSHSSPTAMCRSLSDRLRNDHRYCLSSAENLYKCEGYAKEQLAESAMSNWMHSGSHRQNLINGRFNRVGVGIARQGPVVVFTQVFSYEPVIVQSLQVVPENQGFRVRLTALVADGPKQGGLFVDDRRKLNWEAGADGTFTAELLLPKAGLLQIGQLIGTREWSVDTEIPIPTPASHP